MEVDKPAGAFVLFPSVKAFLGKRIDGSVIRDDDAFANYLLEKKHLAVIPGSAFGAKGYLRLSYACSMEELQAGMERLTRVLRSFSRL